MDAYVYDAGLLCEDCGLAKIRELRRAGAADTGDSDDFPQGPYSDGGGEADGPQSCDACGVALDNPLTGDGVDSVIEAVLEGLLTGSGSLEVLLDWIATYGIDWGTIAEHLVERRDAASIERLLDAGGSLGTAIRDVFSARGAAADSE